MFHKKPVEKNIAENRTPNDVFYFSLNVIEPKFSRLFFSYPIYLFHFLENYLKLSFQCYCFVFSQKFHNFTEKKKIYTMIFCSKNNKKYLTIVVKYIENNENRIFFT